MDHNPKYIHETVIRDIISLIGDFASDYKNGFNIELSNEKAGGMRYMRNIAKGSKGLTLEFPVIVSDAVSVNTASMIAKAIERKAVTMLQMLFSAISITNSRDAISYIQKFHTNMDSDGNMGMDDFTDLMDQISVHSEGFSIKEKEKFREVLEDLRNSTGYYLPDRVAKRSLNEYTVDTTHNGIQIREGAVGAAAGAVAGSAIAAAVKRAAIGAARMAGKQAIKSGVNAAITSASRNRQDYASQDSEKIASDLRRNDRERFTNQQFETDIKKANELVPSMMVIQFTYMTPDGKAIPVENTTVIGVKAKMQYVTSGDMMNRIVLKNKDKNGLFNFIKATTNQISFWKDFIFAIDRAKLDAISTSGKGSSSPIWKLLERRALKSKVRRWTGKVNDASAISTLVISREEVDYLKKEHSMDVTRPNTIFTVMNAYNIMSFVIADETLEKVMFLFDDGSNEYETLSFSHLEREESGSYKKIINLLAKSK